MAQGTILAIANQKGGVAKTTTAINLAASLAATRRRVLLVDLDPQGNATVGCGLKAHQKGGCAALLAAPDTLDKQTLKPQKLGFAVLPGGAELTVAEVRLMQQAQREQQLRQALAGALEQYDYILIDCPPALNILTVNALVAATAVLIPVQCEYYALEGLSALMKTIQDVRRSIHPHLRIEGLLRTLYDPRNRLAKEVSQQLIDHFGNQVYRSIIPRNIRLAEAPGFGCPILQHDRYCSGSLAYLALAGEILRRETNP